MKIELQGMFSATIEEIALIMVCTGSYDQFFIL